MNTRERFRAVTTFKAFDRLPILEWALWWDKTIDRWHGEGLPATLTDRYEICRHFGQDVYCQGWFSPMAPTCPRPSAHGHGIIEDEAGYERILPHLYKDLFDMPDRAPRWKAWAVEQARGDVVLWFTVYGFFWFARELLGIERHLYAFYDQPELIQRINSDLAAWQKRVVERLCEICEPDFMTFAEDLSYNNGPMLSEDLFDTFMLPYYNQVVPQLRRHNILPVVDSDGDVTVPAYWFERAGLAGVLPLERQAGVDIQRLRADHPTMIFVGHVDKMTMNKGEAAMRAEFERLLPVARQGGFLISCDHQTPPGVSYADYQLFMALFKEYAEAAAHPA